MRNDAFDFSSTGKLAFTVSEVRDYTGLSISSIYRLISNDRLRSVKIEGRRFVMRSDLEDLFSRSVRGTKPIALRVRRSKGGSHEH